MVNIIKHRNISITISSVFVIASIISIIVLGLPLGIDFTGGSILEVEYLEIRPDPDALRALLADLGVGSIILQETGERGLILRFQHVDEETHQKIVEQLISAVDTGSIALSSGAVLEEKRFDAIGPVIGSELKQRAIIALAIAIGAIILYIAWAFRHVSEPVSSWKYGIVAVVALLHDVLIPTGVFTVLGALYPVEINALFITALLAILGFSVHDTIVVFDRIRENLIRDGSTESLETVVNNSVNETILRSINTSLTTLFVLGALFVLGGTTIKFFVLALITGTLIGTYSSIFVASPLLVVWYKFSSKT